ncbi:MAG: hypothetical protein IJG63_01560, partial [Oscillospiraceae bacterium]|nr:hypothetical protein [Oscillospiraceae bacterium]
MEPAEIKLSKGTLSAVAAPKSGAFRTMSPEEFRGGFKGASGKGAPGVRPASPVTGKSFGGHMGDACPDRGTQSVLQSFFAPEKASAPLHDDYRGPIYRRGDDDGADTAPVTPPEPAPEETETAIEEPYRIIGEALNTYIIVESGERLLLIDKHAAHERMIYD